MINIKKVFKTLIVVLIICIGGLFLFNQEVNANEQNEQPTNDLMALNYHRVRDDNIINNILRILSVNRELGIYSVSTDDFEFQISSLVEKGANFLTLDRVIEGLENGSFPPNSVWINFDDMDISVYKNAQPILEKYQVPATGFVITGQIGADNFNNLHLMDEEELLEFDDSGLWDFAYHTDDLHYLNDGKSAMAEASAETIETDIQKGQEKLEELFGKSYPVIAYPFGISNDHVQKVLEENGIKYGFTLEDRLIPSTEFHPYYLPRILVTQDSFMQFLDNWEDL